jgi:hypothetical protein
MLIRYSPFLVATVRWLTYRTYALDASVIMLIRPVELEAFCHCRNTLQIAPVCSRSKARVGTVVAHQEWRELASARCAAAHTPTA